MFTKLMLLLAAPALLAAQQMPDTTFHPISQGDAVRLAQQNNLSAIAAVNVVRTANNAVRSTRAQWYPTLTATAGQSKSAGDRIGQSGTLVPYSGGWSYNTGLSSNVTIFDAGKTIADVRAARANVAAAEAGEVNTQYSLELNVKLQYNSILAANEADAAARAQLVVAQQELDMTIAKVNAGAANIADSLNSVVQVGNAQLAILTAQQSLRTANAALSRLVGTPYFVTAIAADTIDRPTSRIDSATVLQLALSGPAINQAEAQLNASNAVIKSAKAAYLPTLGANFSFGGNGVSSPYGFGSNPYPYIRTVGLSLNYQIFNRFSRENTLAAAQIGLENSQAQLKDQKLAAQQTIVTQIGLQRNAEEQIRVQENSVRANEEALRVNQQRYTLGAGTFLDVLTSQSNLVAARNQLIQARLNYRNARAQIEAVIGRPLP